MAVIMVFSDDISGILEDVEEHLSKVGTIMKYNPPLTVVGCILLTVMGWLD